MTYKTIIFLLFYLSYFQLSAQEVSKTQAIQIAENYVMEQGYSKNRLDIKSTVIDTLFIDKYFSGYLDLDGQDTADARFNTLQAKSFYSKKVSKGWLIGFRQTKEYIKREKELFKSSSFFKKTDSLININKLFSEFNIKSKNEAAFLISNDGEVTFLPLPNLKFYSKKYKLIKRTARELETISFSDNNLKDIILNKARVKGRINDDIFYEIDQNNDGEIQIFEAEDVTELTIRRYNFDSLNEIRHFINLKNLKLDRNDIKALDLSKNKNLESLQLTNSQIENIDFRKNKKLKTIDLRWNSLNKIFLPKNVEKLSCDTNNLTSLDLSKCKNLTDLSCPENKFTSLDLSKCKNLTELWMSGNDLIKLNLKKTPKLEHLWIDKNPRLLCVEIDSINIKKIWNFNRDNKVQLKSICD